MASRGPEDFDCAVREGGVRLERLFQRMEQEFGKILRSGGQRAIDLYQSMYLDIMTIGNSRSTELFHRRFFPLLPERAQAALLSKFSKDLSHTLPKRAEASQPKKGLFRRLLGSVTKGRRSLGRDGDNRLI